MFYYHIWVRSIQFHGDEALTYEHSEALKIGAIVIVPLRRQQVAGIVVGFVSKPKFETKPIAKVIDLPPLPPKSLQLMFWLHAFYPSPIGVISGLFLPAKLREGCIDFSSDITLSPLQPELTKSQITALKTIAAPDTYVLHGRTGSGKTRIYTELTAREFSQGRSTIVLSPEIGLTSQLAKNFRHLFGEKVVLIHSRLTEKEREEAWTRILTSKSPLVVIGPRSALFSPLDNIGAIIVDESHDQAYKQEQQPYYNAIRVASQLRSLQHAILILGSATPSIGDYYLALKKNKSIITINELAKKEKYTKRASVVDLKDRAQFSRSKFLSNTLIAAISDSLAQNNQSLLYLNRRGTARVAFCKSCGWESMCSNCDVPFVYHGDVHLLRCHICGRSSPVATSCPDCQNPSIIFRSFGTKAIVDEVARIFPEAQVARFDTDNFKADRLENVYEEVLRGKVDILVGTQMLTKGLDLPRLSTLGVILADATLYVPDYTAQERTYQTLSQVLGRVGRGHIKSHAVIQTYHPNSRLLLAVLGDDWRTFYESELAERKKYFFPPFCHLLKLSCKRGSVLSAEATAQKLANAITLANPAVSVEGPAPAFHEKNAGKYTWQLIVKTRQRQALLTIIANLPAGWTYDIDPAGLL